MDRSGSSCHFDHGRRSIGRPTCTHRSFTKFCMLLSCSSSTQLPWQFCQSLLEVAKEKKKKLEKSLNQISETTYIIRLPQLRLSMRKLTVHFEWTFIILKPVLAKSSFVFRFVYCMVLHGASYDLSRWVVKVSGSSLVIKAFSFVPSFPVWPSILLICIVRASIHATVHHLLTARITGRLV